MALGIANRFKPRNVTEIECTAYHEAGHAFIMMLNDIPITEISIKPYKESKGRVISNVSKIFPSQKDEPGLEPLIKLISANYAGCISEALYSGTYNEEMADQDLLSNVEFTLYFPVDEEENTAFLDWIWLRTFNIMKFEPNWFIIDVIAKALIKKKRLTGNEVFESIRSAGKPPLEPAPPPGLNPNYISY